MTKHFTPTKAQLSVLKHMQSLDYDADVRSACRGTGVHRADYYNWLVDPAFLAWWNQEMDRHFSTRRGAVLVALFKAATTPQIDGKGQVNVEAIKVFLERFDKHSS